MDVPHLRSPCIRWVFGVFAAWADHDYRCREHSWTSLCAHRFSFLLGVYIRVSKLGFGEPGALRGEEVGRGSMGGLGWHEDPSWSGRLGGLGSKTGSMGWCQGRLLKGCGQRAWPREARLGGAVGEGQATGDGRGSFVSQTEWAQQGSQTGTSSEAGKDETDPRLRGNPLGSCS